MKLPERYTKDRLSAYDCLLAWRALKAQFSDLTNLRYNIFKYNGVTTHEPSLEEFTMNYRKYRGRTFQKIADMKDPIGYMLANMVSNNMDWIEKILGEQGEETYKAWQASQESLLYQFKQDLLNAQAEYFDDLILVGKSQTPQLLSLVLAKKFNLESLCIVQDILNFFPYWDEAIEEPYIWPSLRFKATAYLPFLDYDKAKAQTILESVFPELKMTA